MIEPLPITAIHLYLYLDPCHDLDDERGQE
jgi:hypothetical protein